MESDRKFSSLAYGHGLDDLFTFIILRRRSMRLVLICNLHSCRSSRVACWLSHSMLSKSWHAQRAPRPRQVSERIRPSCNASCPDRASLIIWPVLGVFAHFACLALTLTKQPRNADLIVVRRDSPFFSSIFACVGLSICNRVH